MSLTIALCHQPHCQWIPFHDPAMYKKICKCPNLSLRLWIATCQPSTPQITYALQPATGCLPQFEKDAIDVHNLFLWARHSCWRVIGIQVHAASLKTQHLKIWDEPHRINHLCKTAQHCRLRNLIPWMSTPIQHRPCQRKLDINDTSVLFWDTYLQVVFSVYMLQYSVHRIHIGPSHHPDQNQNTALGQAIHFHGLSQHVWPRGIRTKPTSIYRSSHITALCLNKCSLNKSQLTLNLHPPCTSEAYCLGDIITALPSFDPL